MENNSQEDCRWLTKVAKECYSKEKILCNLTTKKEGASMLGKTLDVISFLNAFDTASSHGIVTSIHDGHFP